MKRLISILLCLLLMGSLSVVVYAADIISLGDSHGLVMDEANLLTDEEEAELSQMAQIITQRQACDVAIVTVDDIGSKTAEAYADDYFDYNGYGYGSQRSGILFLIADRNFAISTRGEAIQAFPDDGLYYIFNKLQGKLSGGYYYDAFHTFLEASNSMLNIYRGTATQAEMDEFGDFFQSGTVRQPRGLKHYVVSILAALAIGFLVASIPMGVLKSEVKNVRRNYNASNYVQKDSLQMNVSRDVYLYANTTSHVIQRASSNSGGGSSTHVSSSGATHGGISGKF